MAKKQIKETETQGDEMAVKSHVFPLWLYKKNESKLFKSKEQFEEQEDQADWKDSPVHFEGK